MYKPQLNTGVRLTYDRVRKTHVVLYPEGVLFPNPTAVAVLELCDGSTGVPDIIGALGERFSGVREQDVLDVLHRLADRRVIRWTT